MKWEKLGLIFNPDEHRLPGKCFGFAQSPQVLVQDNFVRIYFSTRERDQTGKFLSQVAFVDFSKDFQTILQVASEPVIALGGLGEFDEHGIFPLNVLEHEGNILGFSGGWTRRVSVSVDAAIGLVTSGDGGNHFTKVGRGPILTPSLTEPFLVGDPFVMFHAGLFHMWYVHGVRWLRHDPACPPDRVYKIGYAKSADAKKWEKYGRQIIADRLNVDECQALPSVVQIGDRFHMIFCYRQAIGFREEKQNAYRLGYAFSDDLQNWTRDDAQVGIDVSAEGWDSEMLCYPHLFKCESSIYLLYNGNQFGRCGFGIAKLIEG